jgi:hypothetical protein
MALKADAHGSEPIHYIRHRPNQAATAYLDDAAAKR